MTALACDLVVRMEPHCESGIICSTPYRNRVAVVSYVCILVWYVSDITAPVKRDGNI